MPILCNVPIPDEPEEEEDNGMSIDLVHTTTDPRFTGYKLTIDERGNIVHNRPASLQPLLWVKGRYGSYSIRKVKFV